MVSAYPACFFKEETGYTVVFPDLNWLSTCGETLEEALALSLIHILRWWLPALSKKKAGSICFMWAISMRKGHR